MNSKIFERLIFMLRKSSVPSTYRNYIVKPILCPSTFEYSTTTSKSLDVLDFYSDLISHKSPKLGIENLSPVPLQKKLPLNEEPSKTSHVDLIISDMDMTNPHITSKTLANKLSISLENMDFSEISKIIKLCTDKKIPLSSSLLSTIASKYSNSGLVEDLLLLRTMCEFTNEKQYHENAEFLHYLAYCYWICGNSIKCVNFLKECCDKYPSLNDVTKRVLQMIITQAVSSRSQAQLVIVTEFIKEFTERFSDYYLLTVLWKNLFLSEWFADQQLASELLNSNEELQKCMALIVPPLLSYLLRINKVQDIYRFLPILLMYNHTNQYSTALQLLFDHFRNLGYLKQCTEIVKSSIELKTPLREEQYRQFISWTAFGSPLKYIGKKEIEKFYSSF